MYPLSSLFDKSEDSNNMIVCFGLLPFISIIRYFAMKFDWKFTWSCVDTSVVALNQAFIFFSSRQLINEQFLVFISTYIFVILVFISFIRVSQWSFQKHSHNWFHRKSYLQRKNILIVYAMKPNWNYTIQ